MLLAFTTIFASCKEDEEEVKAPSKNIAQLVIDTDNLSSLEAALIKADLVSVFQGHQGTTQYTVFAPTNAAFTAFLTANNLTLETVPVPLLTAVLLRHVVAGEAKSTALSNGQVIPTLNPAASLTVNISGTTIKVNNATVTQANVDATNGVVHIIDQVIQ